jgi:hypothetical protein
MYALQNDSNRVRLKALGLISFVRRDARRVRDGVLRALISDTAPAFGCIPCDWWSR